LENDDKKRLNNKKRLASFPTTSINRNKKSGLDENHGLAKELSEEFEKQKIDFINKLREIDKGNRCYGMFCVIKYNLIKYYLN